MSQWKWPLLEAVKSVPLKPLEPWPMAKLYAKRQQEPVKERFGDYSIQDDAPVNSVKLAPTGPKGLSTQQLAQILDAKEHHESPDHEPSASCMFCRQEFRRWQKRQLDESALQQAHKLRNANALNLADNFLREHGCRISRKGFLK